MLVVERARAAALLFVVAAIAPAAAHADERWLLSLEGAAAMPVTAPQTAWFEPGASVAASLFHTLASPLAVGARVRGGLLADGPAPQDATLADPGVGSMLSFGVGARLRLEAAWDASPRRGTGPWLDAFGAAVVTGAAVRPGIEVGIGYSFEVGDVDLGATARWLTIFETESQLAPAHANLLLIGIEIVFFDGRPAPIVEARETPRSDEPARTEEVSESQRCRDPDRCDATDTDGDAIPDARDACPRLREVVNGIADGDGCPDEGLIELVDDRIVLEERVLFDLQRARLRHSAMPVLRAIVELYRQHPEWIEMRIEGHADVRGTRRYNQWLSELRAERVREALVELGMPGGAITSAGFGERVPRAVGEGEAIHQRNRRVEFVVVRRAVHANGGPER